MSKIDKLREHNRQEAQHKADGKKAADTGSAGVLIFFGIGFIIWLCASLGGVQ